MNRETLNRREFAVNRWNGESGNLPWIGKFTVNRWIYGITSLQPSKSVLLFFIMFLSIWNTTSVISNYPTERNVSLRNIMRRMLHLLTLLLFFKHIPLVQFYVLCFEFCVTTCYSYNSWIFCVCLRIVRLFISWFGHVT